MNKRGGGEEIMFFAFFFIIGIIVLGIVWGVSALNVRSYDYRLVEANLLAHHVFPCLEENDFFEEGFKEEFFETCKINENTFTDHLVYVRNVNTEEVFFVGVLDYVNQCQFKGADSNKNFPRCISIDTGNGQYELIVGANQRSKRGLV